MHQKTGSIKMMSGSEINNEFDVSPIRLNQGTVLSS